MKWNYERKFLFSKGNERGINNKIWQYIDQFYVVEPTEAATKTRMRQIGN